MGTLAARSATITTDTGAFAPGHQDFTRYDTPGLCLVAAQSVHTVLRRSIAAQVERDTLFRDTTGDGETAKSARACGARFTVTGTPTQERQDLLNLALMEQNNSLVQAVLDTLLTQARTTDARVALFGNVFRTYLRQGNPAAAQTLIARVDALGPSASRAQIDLHSALATYEEARGQIVAARRETAIVLAKMRTTNIMDSEKNYSWVLSAYEDLMRLTVPLNVQDSNAAVARLAQGDLGHFPSTISGSAFGPSHPGAHDHVNLWRVWPLDTVIAHLSPTWYHAVRYAKHELAPRLTADYWLPAPGHAASDTLFPVPGKVNLLCKGGEPDMNAYFYGNQFGPGLKPGYRQAAAIRRWLGMYDADSLAVAIVKDAPGYYVYDEPWKFARRIKTSAEEARVWRWYYQTYEQLPVTLAVQVVHHEWYPPPDGRRKTDSPLPFWHYIDMNTDQYDVGARKLMEPGACAIIGRHGELIYSGLGSGFDYTGSDWIGSFVGQRNVYDTILWWLFKGHDAAPGFTTTPASTTPRPVSGNSRGMQ